MELKFILDENIPLQIAYKLREQNFEVISITESFRGSTDLEIIEISKKEKAFVLTFDKDFGELIVRSKIQVSGIVILRFQPYSVDYIFNRLVQVIKFLNTHPEDNFIIVDENKLRIRRLK